MISTLDAFLYGYKPAFLINPEYSSLYDKSNLEKLDSYPTLPVQVYDMDQHLYFQTEELKEHFKTSTHDADPNSPKFHYKLGLALGFPPKACKFYSATFDEDKSDNPERVSIHFCGISFVSHITDIKDNIQWMWDNIQIPSQYIEKTRVCYDFQFDTYNTHQLDQVHSHLESALEIQRT
ncbi:hypothetical protein IC619_015515 [Hazenella sp. IB182353]|uniref:hypothetical protein n=1 Tax=Polycladospora coralii TaxID=2771432 RepID=UPI001746038F|nr:hypothetical protein [Polycladospora coralii]MBS7531881.1 hypothetical protein [Polycladospora coralii]